MGSYLNLEVKPIDVDELCQNIREADKREISALTKLPMHFAIRKSIRASQHCFSLYVGLDLVCIWGVSIREDKAHPWMIGTHQISNHKREFWKASKEALRWMKTLSPHLENHVFAEHTEAIVWLQRLGFAIEEPSPYGCDKKIFSRFWLEN